MVSSFKSNFDANGHCYCLRKFALLENVSAILSEKQRDLMEYLLQDICVYIDVTICHPQFLDTNAPVWPCPTHSFQESDARGLKLVYCTVNGKMVGAPVGQLSHEGFWQNTKHKKYGA